MEARIPFAGFYESMWSHGVDEEEERLAENLAEEHDVIEREVAELIFQNTTYSTAYAHVAEKYVPAFEEFLNEALDMKISLTYKDMTSPKYYNFETDQLFAEVKYEDMLRLARRVGRNALRKAAKQMFTSRDGFISFYRYDPAEWGRLRGWDHNQLYCLLTAAVDVIGDDNWDWSIYEDINESNVFGEALDKAMDYPAIMLGIGKITGKKELLEEFAECDDGKRFPVAWKDTADYVEKFHKLNSKGL